MCSRSQLNINATLTKQYILLCGMAVLRMNNKILKHTLESVLSTHHKLGDNTFKKLHS